MLKNLRAALTALLVAICVFPQAACASPAATAPAITITTAGSSIGAIAANKRRSSSVLASPLFVGVNMPVVDWWIYSTPFADTAYSAPGNTATEFGGFTGSTTGNTIPDANRDANGNVKSVPGGEAAISFVSQFPPTLAQRRLTWSSKAGGANQGAATMSMPSGATGVTVDLVNRTVTYTPTGIADGSATTPPVFRYTPVSTTDYPVSFVDRPVVDAGTVPTAEFASLITDANSAAPVIRFMDWTSDNRLNSAIHQTASAGKTISAITFSGTTATVTTSTAHGLLGIGTASQSASVTVSGVTPSTYNVTDAFVKVISPTQFQYTMGGTPTGNATVVGSYTVGDAGFQSTNLHYPSVGTEPGTQFNEPIYTSANRNKNKADGEWHDGVALESIVSLTTSLGASPYYPAPPNADSTFYADAASVLATSAAATGKPVYVSVGNEGWNPGFPWFHQLRNEANLRGTLGDALPSARLVATGNIALTGAQSVDGVAVVTGDRIIVPLQSTASQNGVYVANTAGAWSRAADTLAYRAIWSVTSGLTSANSSWFISTQGTIVPGTTALTIARISNAQRYAEKVVEVANAFRTAFASAGVSSQLHVVAEWQNYAGTTIWDDMAAFVGPTDWAKITELSVAPYYGDNSNMGIAASYVGSTATLKTAISADIDDTLTHMVGHVAKAVAMGKKLITYEGGSTINLSNNAYRNAWARSSDAYDLELRFLQQMELRAAPLQAGGLVHLQYNLVYPLGGNAFSWGLAEGLTLPHTLAASPKLKAHMDFKAGVRVLSASTGTLPSVSPSAPIGTTIGTLSGSAYPVLWSLTNNDGGRVAINSATGTVTVAGDLSASAGSRSFTNRQTRGAATFDTVTNYTVAAPFADNFNDNATDAMWTNGGYALNATTGGTAVEQNGRVEVTIPAGAGIKAGGYVSGVTDLRDRLIFIRVANASVLTGHDVAGYLHVASSANSHQGWTINPLSLSPDRWDGSSHSDGTDVTYDGSATWVALRFISSGNQVQYLTAASTAPNPPALSDFTDRGTVPLQTGIDMSAARIAFGLYTWDGDSISGSIQFDGFNTGT